jgi:hypothetical protein
MEKNPSLEANSCSRSHEILPLVWNPKFHCLVHNGSYSEPAEFSPHSKALLLQDKFLAYFPYLKNRTMLMTSSCCLSMYPSVSVHLSVYPPKFFRFMRSFCCVSVFPSYLSVSVRLCVYLS